MAAIATFENPRREGEWALSFARTVLQRAPNQRIGIICRTAPRRQSVDQIAEGSGLPFYRWDDGVLDTETARVMKVMLLRLKAEDALAAEDSLQFLRDLAEHEAIIDPDTRKSVAEALIWCLDLLRDGVAPLDIRDRIRVGNQATLLTAAGIHLLSGHVGKGQQFDWVIVVGAEDDVIPDWRSVTVADQLEDARVLSVMISRARHGVVVTSAQNVPTVKGKAKMRQPSRFFVQLRTALPTNLAGVSQFLETTDWETTAAR